MRFDEFQELATRTMSESTDLTVGVLGLAGESGEVADMRKKELAQGHDYHPTDYILELGDILWYLAICAEQLGVSLEEIARANIEKLRKRYPLGFEAKRSTHRENYQYDPPETD